MEKAVMLRFKNRYEIIEFRTTVGLPWNAVNLDELVLTTTLGERELELALSSYNAEVITAIPSTDDKF